MTDSIALTVKKDVEPLIEEVAALTITGPETMEVATELLSRLNKLGDRIEGEKEKTMRPALDTVAAIRAQWAPFEKPVAANVLEVRAKMTRYQTEARKKEDTDKDAIAARIGEGKGKLKPETALNKMDAVAAPEKKVTTASGSIQFITMPVFKLLDISKVPAEYLLLNESAVRKAQKSNIPIPGIEYGTEEVPRNSR